jgi:hypothetical protein
MRILQISADDSVAARGQPRVFESGMVERMLLYRRVLQRQRRGSWATFAAQDFALFQPLSKAPLDCVALPGKDLIDMTQASRCHDENPELSARLQPYYSCVAATAGSQMP